MTSAGTSHVGYTDDHRSLDPQELNIRAALTPEQEDVVARVRAATEAQRHRSRPDITAQMLGAKPSRSARGARLVHGGMKKLAAAKRLGITVKSIEATYTRIFGVRPPSDRKRSQADRDAAIAAARAGKHVTQIAHDLGTSRPFVRAVLTAAGVSAPDGRQFNTFAARRR